MSDPGESLPTDRLTTPDNGYFIAEQKLWRLGNPGRPVKERERLLSNVRRAKSLMNDRRGGDRAGARKALFEARVALGEIGPVWWSDDAPDYSRRLVAKSPYAQWFAALGVTQARKPRTRSDAPKQNDQDRSDIGARPVSEAERVRKDQERAARDQV